jgi:hypothetical protein
MFLALQGLAINPIPYQKYFVKEFDNVEKQE